MDIPGSSVPHPPCWSLPDCQRWRRRRLVLACYYDGPEYRVFSLRSRAPDGEDVSEIAKQYGGGGHRHASGFRYALTQVHELDP